MPSYEQALKTMLQHAKQLGTEQTGRTSLVRLIPTYDNVTVTGWDIPYTLDGNYDYNQIPFTTSDGINITAGIASLHEWVHQNI